MNLRPTLSFSFYYFIHFYATAFIIVKFNDKYI